MEKYDCKEVVIVDFETTGLSARTDRIIEVGAVLVKNNKVIDRFSQLMNPGRRIPYVITKLTGITGEMLKGKPRPEEVMPKLKEFIGDRVILAHNAAFDSKFLYAEMKRANLIIDNPLLCTLLLSRRLVPNIENYKLGTVAKHFNVTITNAHRALDDVEATAKIWDHLYQTVCSKTGLTQPDNQMFETISRMPKDKVGTFFGDFKGA